MVRSRTESILESVPPHLRPTVERLLSTPEPERRLMAQRLLQPGAPKQLRRVVIELRDRDVA